MTKLGAFIWKEILLLQRDLHGLALLFVMPIIFILVMTFALQNQYGSSADIQVNYFLFDNSNTGDSTRIADHLTSQKNFRRIPSDNIEKARLITTRGEADFIIIIPKNFPKAEENTSQLQLKTAPDITPVMTQFIRGQLEQISQRLFLEATLRSALNDRAPNFKEIAKPNLIKVTSLFSDKKQPSSVQQNVPAWLLFAMFFIAIPLSTTLINERQQGTLRRLESMNFPLSLLFLGKLLPYFLVTQLQAIAMLTVGVVLVPLLGGEALSLGDNYTGLALISISASVAAVCYSLLIAELAQTVEQATILTGVCNILMAAIGGVMVPRFIMPAGMQELSVVSPMSWGLDGFLDIFLRGGSAVDVIPEMFALCAFAVTMLTIATLLHKHASLR